MVQLNDLACHLLRVEQQILAYQKLHTDELAELWQTLDQCKREITAALSELGLDPYEPLSASEAPAAQPQQPEGEQEAS